MEVSWTSTQDETEELWRGQEPHKTNRLEARVEVEPTNAGFADPFETLSSLFSHAIPSVLVFALGPSPTPVQLLGNEVILRKRKLTILARETRRNLGRGQRTIVGCGWPSCASVGPSLS
jgi:hypothetical protein